MSLLQGMKMLHTDNTILIIKLLLSLNLFSAFPTRVNSRRGSKADKMR